MDRKIHIKISNMNYEHKVINLIWKNFDFVESQLSELAISDGKYKIMTTNPEGDPIDSGMGIWQLTKLGRFIKIYLKKIESGETIVYKSFKIKTTKTRRARSTKQHKINRTNTNKGRRMRNK